MQILADENELSRRTKMKKLNIKTNQELVNLFIEKSKVEIKKTIAGQIANVERSKNEHAHIMRSQQLQAIEDGLSDENTIKQLRNIKTIYTGSKINIKQTLKDTKTQNLPTVSLPYFQAINARNNNEFISFQSALNEIEFNDEKTPNPYNGYNLNFVEGWTSLHFADIFDTGSEQLSNLNPIYIDYTKSFYMLDKSTDLVMNINKDNYIMSELWEQIGEDKNSFINKKAENVTNYKPLPLLKILSKNLLKKLLHTYSEDSDNSIKYNYSEKRNVIIYFILISFYFNISIMNKTTLIDNELKKRIPPRWNSILTLVESTFNNTTSKKSILEPFPFGSKYLQYIFIVDKTETVKIYTEEILPNIIKYNLETFITYLLNGQGYFSVPSNSNDLMSTSLQKNPFIMNTLTLLYREVMTPIKVITKLSDVQCNKGIYLKATTGNEMNMINKTTDDEYKVGSTDTHWKPRSLQDYFVSGDGKRLLYVYKGDDLNKYEGTNNASHRHYFTFDYMNHIYGPNDTPKTMAIKLNKDIYALLQNIPDENNTQNILYFTYGFSGSGKTFTTNALIKEIINYIVKTANKDVVKSKHIKDIKLKYFEVPSLVVKDRDILCSGRYQSASSNFNKTYYNAFNDNNNGPVIRLYAADNSLYHIEVPLDKKKPIIVYEEDFMNFYDLNKTGLKFLFEIISAENDSGQNKILKNNIATNYSYPKSLVYKGTNGWKTLTVHFVSAQHATYWCKYFFNFDDDSTQTSEIFNEDKNDGETISNKLLFSDSLVSVKQSTISYYNINNYKLTTSLFDALTNVVPLDSKDCDPTEAIKINCLTNWENIKKLFITRFKSWWENKKKQKIKNISNKFKGTNFDGKFNNQNYCCYTKNQFSDDFEWTENDELFDKNWKKFDSYKSGDVEGRIWPSKFILIPTTFGAGTSPAGEEASNGKKWSKIYDAAKNYANRKKTGQEDQSTNLKLFGKDIFLINAYKFDKDIKESRKDNAPDPILLFRDYIHKSDYTKHLQSPGTLQIQSCKAGCTSGSGRYETEKKAMNFKIVFTEGDGAKRLEDMNIMNNIYNLNGPRIFQDINGNTSQLVTFQDMNDENYFYQFNYLLGINFGTRGNNKISQDNGNFMWTRSHFEGDGHGNKNKMKHNYTKTYNFNGFNKLKDSRGIINDRKYALYSQEKLTLRGICINSAIDTEMETYLDENFWDLFKFYMTTFNSKHNNYHSQGRWWPEERNADFAFGPESDEEKEKIISRNANKYAYRIGKKNAAGWKKGTNDEKLWSKFSNKMRYLLLDWKKHTWDKLVDWPLGSLNYFNGGKDETPQNLLNFIKTPGAVELIYKKMFHYIKDQKVIEFEKNNTSVEDAKEAIKTYKPLFLSIIQTPNAKDSNVTSRGGHFFYHFVVNVSGFEKHLPKSLITEFNRYERDTTKSSSKINQTAWKFKQLLDNEINSFKTNQTNNILNEKDVDNVIKSLKKLKSDLFKNETKNESDIKILLQNNNFDSTWINNTQLNNIKNNKKYTNHYFELKKLETAKLIDVLANNKFTNNQLNQWNQFINRAEFKTATDPRDIYVLKNGTTKFNKTFEASTTDTKWVKVEDSEFGNDKTAFIDDKLEKNKKGGVTEPMYIKLSKEVDKFNKLDEEKYGKHMKYVDIFKQKKATYNNDESSRSHIIYEILIQQEGHGDSNNNIGHKLIICDLAGKEDVIDATKMNTYIENEYNNFIKSTSVDGNNMGFLIEMDKLYESKYHIESGKTTTFERNKDNIVDKKKMAGSWDDIEPYVLFYMEDDEFKPNLSQNNKYLLDLLSEGRMINSTLENLNEVVKPTTNIGTNIPSFYYLPTTNDILEDYYNNKTNQGKIIEKMTVENKNISNDYYEKSTIAQREFKMLGIEEPKNLKDKNEWMKVEKQLANKINNVKGTALTTNYILLTVNLNERSNKGDLKEQRKGEGGGYKAESTLSTFNFINKLATLRLSDTDKKNMISAPKYFSSQNFNKLYTIQGNVAAGSGNTDEEISIYEPLLNVKYTYIDNYNSICQKLQYNNINILYRSPFYERVMLMDNKGTNNNYDNRAFILDKNIDIIKEVKNKQGININSDDHGCAPYKSYVNKMTGETPLLNEQCCDMGKYNTSLRDVGSDSCLKKPNTEQVKKKEAYKQKVSAHKKNVDAERQAEEDNSELQTSKPMWRSDMKDSELSNDEESNADMVEREKVRKQKLKAYIEKGITKLKNKKKTVISKKDLNQLLQKILRGPRVIRGKRKEYTFSDREKDDLKQIMASVKDDNIKLENADLKGWIDSFGQKGGNNKRRRGGNKSLKKRMKLKRNISLKGGRKRKLKKNIRKTLKKKRSSSFKMKNLKIQSKARRNRNTLKRK